MDKDCAIARDLMPQVIDNVASEESREFVQEHMEGCQPCTQVFADMANEVQGAQTSEPVSFKSAMSQLKKTLGWKRIRTATFAVLVTTVLILVGYNILFQDTSLGHMPLDAYEVKIMQSSRGSAYAITQFQKTTHSTGSRVTFEEDTNILYIDWSAPLIPILHDDALHFSPTFGSRFMLNEDGTLLYLDDMQVLEIRQGTPKNYIVVYQAGDTVPSMDAATDEYLLQRDLYLARMDEAYQAMADAKTMSYEAQIDHQDFLLEWEREQRAQPTETPLP